MKNTFKTVLALVAFSALSVQAEESNKSPSKKMPGPVSVPNPSGRWGVTGGANVFFTAEALVFKISQESAPYAYSDSTTTASSTAYNLDLQYKWGFRVAAGYNIPHDKWDVVGTYTRFNVSTTSSVTQPVGTDLYAPGGAAIDSASNYWTVNFNMFDVEQGRQFFVSKYLRIRPKFGLRNVFLDNDQDTTFNTAAYASTQMNEHFWGMGVLGGLDTVWTLGCGISIYGNVALAGLFGYSKPTLQVNTDDVATTGYNTSGHLENTKANLDLALGLRWDRNFYDDRYHVGFNFGFEQHIFFNMLHDFNNNVTPNYTYDNFAGVSGRDFTMSGWTLGMRFDF
jgi:hypothetical protein